MLLYSACYAVTLPLVNAVLFANEAAMKAIGFDVGCLFTLFGVEVSFVGFVFLWAPVAWAIAGYGLTFWRAKRGVGDGSDCLMLAAWMSLFMAVACYFLGETPKPQAVAADTGVVVEATKTIGGFLAQPEVYLFLLVQFLVVGVQQFYFMGTGSFLTSSGKIQEKSISAIMATAQVCQALATLFLLGKMGNQATLIVGTLCWSLLFAVYILGKPIGLMIPIQAFHGLAYVFFVIAGQNYMKVLEGIYSGGSLQATAQGILLVVTNGFGLFLGTWLGGKMIDAAKDHEGRVAWPKVWTTPFLLTLVGAAIFYFSPFVETPAAADVENPTLVEQPADPAAEPADDATEVPATVTPATETPAPEAPAPEAPAPEAPAPEAPAPEVPAPEAPAPEAPVPEAPVPEAPAPEAPAPEVPAPEAPAPEAPAPEAPAPEAPAPEVPAPEAPAPEAPAPEAPGV